MREAERGREAEAERRLLRRAVSRIVLGEGARAAKDARTGAPPLPPPARATASRMASENLRTPTHAEQSRTLARRARTATLCTIAREPAGYPYGSFVTVAVDVSGRPLFLLSRLAEHTQNLLRREDASVLFTEPYDRTTPPLATGRVTLLGPCRAIPEAERAAARASFLEAHPDAASHVDFDDFGFYRLDPVILRYIGGFGKMSWIPAGDYFMAAPDPLADAADGILAHMNGDHADAVVDYARVLGGIADATSAKMTSVDRYGFDLDVTTPAGKKTARLGFASPATTTDEVRQAMIALVRKAREK